MDTFHKLLKAGTVCLSCVCSTLKADPKIMTLEELQKFLDQQCETVCTTLQNIREKIEAGNQTGFDPRQNEAEHSYSYEVPKEFSKNFKGITCVKYGENRKPTYIETINGWGSEASEALQIIPSEDNTPFRQYIGERFSGKTSTECLDRVSEKLTTEELAERKVTDADMEKYKIASVREITFDSILSGFFDDQEKIKANSWFSDPGKLNEAINNYVEKAIFLEFVECNVKNTCINLETDIRSNDSKFEIHEKKQEPTEFKSGFFYKVSDDQRQEMQETIAGELKRLLEVTNGKEKVILLLLLDEKTLPEFQLKWVYAKGGHSYEQKTNWILFDFKTNKYKFLSHEIGHYLQEHLGLHKALKTNDDFREAFKSYQMEFAKQLLLLTSTEQEMNEKIIDITYDLSDSIALFYDNPHRFDKQIRFDQFSQKDLFIHWQLVSRWYNECEISNILGIYFSSKGIIYIHALSDIRELQSIRYGHCCRNLQYESLKDPKNGEYLQKFETPEAQNAFETIVTKAAKQKPSTDILKLLCKLHKRPNDEKNVINVFDYNIESFQTQYPSCFEDFKTADK